MLHYPVLRHRGDPPELAAPRRTRLYPAGSFRRGTRRVLCTLAGLFSMRWMASRLPEDFLAARSPSFPLETPATAGHETMSTEEVTAAGSSSLVGALPASAALWSLWAGSAQAAAIPAAEASINPTDAIVQAFFLTFVSEIGDKTFFIAAVLAAGGKTEDGEDAVRSQKVLTFLGAIAALAVMTGIAVLLGQVFHSVPDIAGGIPLDDYVAILCFGYFGVKLLLDASAMKDDGNILEEKEEAEEDLAKFVLPSWLSAGGVAVLPALVVEAFILVFAAEIGDRSFISATALSAAGGPEGALAVFIGSISAHAIATGIAVLLGDLISSYISERQITFIGGALFLVFAASTTAKLVTG